MSFTQYPQVSIRLQRSLLAVPACNPHMFEKAAASDADVILFDCEDAVAPDDKAQARDNVIQALHGMDWRSKTLSVRVNGLDTQYMYRDLIEIVEKAGTKLHTVMVPKVGNASDLYMVDCLLTQIESAINLKHHIGIEGLIETALGGANVMTIAQSSSRLEALHFGSGDYAASMRARTSDIGAINPDYQCEGAVADQWHSAMVNIVTACRACGLRAIDGPYADFKDPNGYIDAAKRAAVLGFEGKWAIHPGQIKLANDIMSPAQHEVDQARQVLAALDDAAKAGKGAAQLDGRMIDAANERMARNIVQTFELIKNK